MVHKTGEETGLIKLSLSTTRQAVTMKAGRIVWGGVGETNSKSARRRIAASWAVGSVGVRGSIEKEKEINRDSMWSCIPMEGVRQRLEASHHPRLQAIRYAIEEHNPVRGLGRWVLRVRGVRGEGRVRMTPRREHSTEEARTRLLFLRESDVAGCRAAGGVSGGCSAGGGKDVITTSQTVS